MTLPRLAVLPLCCLFLHACIEGEEDVWIGADGAARVKAVYRVPAIALSQREADEFTKTLEHELGTNENLRLVTNRVDTVRGTRVINIEIETDDLLRLEGMMPEHPPDAELPKADKILHALLGHIDARLDGRRAVLRREVDIKPLLDEYLGKNSAVMLSDSEFRYTVHLPSAVEGTNAHDVSDDRRTLRWRYNLAGLKGKPMVMQLSAVAPVPWWLYALGAVAVLLLAGAVWGFRRRPRICSRK